MKTLLMNALQTLWADESGQGATEYILLLVVVVALGLIFRGKITGFVKNELGQVSSGLTNFNNAGG